jgi:glyceraldehyde 3-phosphate dehydrogenase
MAKVGINGLGRIGRAALKIILDTPQLDLIAVNDIVPVENLAYLLKYDTVYGRFGKTVSVEDGDLVIDDKRYKMLNEKDPAQLPWGDLGVEIVLECSGVFTRREDMVKHIDAGAQYVLLSAPAKSEDVATIVHGVNTGAGEAETIASCASCTTNAITPVVEVMTRRVGVKKAIMTTVHAYTSSQKIVDSPSKSVRRGRAGAANLVPTSTGAAIATTKALPELKGRFDGVAVRAPVPCGSIADIIFVAERETTVDEINRIFREEADTDRYRGILGVTDDPWVSSDIIGDPRASVVDLEMTQVVDGDLVKVMTWYDNEWGYTAQLVRQAVDIANVL